MWRRIALGAEPVVGVEVSGERLAQGGDLLAHLPPRQFGEHVRVGLAGDQRVEHVARTCP